MTTHSHHDEGTLPPELAGIGAKLDQLGLHEGASAGAGFEDRLMLGTRGAIGPGLPAELAAASAGAEAVALADRAGAGPALEDRIFMATRALLRPSTRAEAEPEVVVVRRSVLWWARPAAAAAAAIGLTVTAWLALRPGQPTTVPTPAAPEIGIVALASADSELEFIETVGLGSGMFDSLGGVSAEELHDDLEALTQNVRGEWFQLGPMINEEAM